MFVFFSGKTWLYKGVAVTYLKGHTSSYIHDFIHFPAEIIESGLHQEWLISKNYNNNKLPDFINPVNDSLETVALMVIKNDSIVFEEYWSGYSSDTMSNSFSMAKSWVSTLIGVAIREGKIESVNQKVCEFIPGFLVGEKEKITIKHLLTMSAGLNWTEDYYNPIGQTSEAYFGNDLRGLVVDLKSVAPPGQVFKYHSSCSQLLAFIIEKAVGKTISEYASEKLWRPMGAKHPALWSLDKKNGDEKAFCCINSNARDFARFGKLYINNGKWDNEIILDSSFVELAIKPVFDSSPYYGYGWWLYNYEGKKVFTMNGHRGQFVISFPEENIIIVRQGSFNEKGRVSNSSGDLYKYISEGYNLAKSIE